ncbi:hypothetical protein BH09VER1_BH09VER1_47440 [soil metagenome]
MMQSIALEPNDIWGEVYLKLQRKNPSVPSEPALMKLVKKCARNHILDKGRKNRTRQSVISDFITTGEETNDAASGQLREYDPEKSPRPDDLLLAVESLNRLKEIGLSDPQTAPVFLAICALEENGLTPSIVNLAQYLGRPYASVRRSRLRLQEAIYQALLTDYAGGKNVRLAMRAKPPQFLPIRSQDSRETPCFR